MFSREFTSMMEPVMMCCFEKSMYALKPNEISQPVVSQFGVHLIQLLDRREVDVSEQKRRDSNPEVRRACR